VTWKSCRVVVIGAGLVGDRHARLVSDHPGCELGAIVDPRPEMQSLATGFGCAWHGDIGEIATGEYDAAIIATPNHTHHEIGLQCLDRGLPCLIEKPLTDDLESGRQLVEAFERAGISLLAGHHRRYHPFVVETNKLLESGVIGTPVCASIIWAVKKPDSYFEKGAWRLGADGGPIMIHLIHEIDLLRCVFGEIFEVCAITSNSACGENPNIAETGVSSWRVGCTNGAFEFPNLRVWQNAGDGQGDWSKPLVSRAVNSDTVQPLQKQLDHFARVVRGEIGEPKVSGRDGLNSLKATRAILHSASTGQPVIISEFGESAPPDKLSDLAQSAKQEQPV